MTLIKNIYEQFKEWTRALAREEDEGDSSFVVSEDAQKVEVVLCLERVLRFCYQLLARRAHNGMLCHQCQGLLQWSLAHEKELRKILSVPVANEASLEQKYQGYALTTADLAIEPLLDLGLAVAGHRLDIYRDLRRIAQTQNRILMNYLIAHAMDEIKFFKKEEEMFKNEQGRGDLSLTKAAEVNYSLN